METSHGASPAASGATTNDLALACLELRSIAVGYKALAWITAEVASVRVLDASPAAAGFMILIQGPASSLLTIGSRLQPTLDRDSTESVWKDFVVVQKHAHEISESLFALPKVDLAESLIVAECESVGGLLAAAEILIHDYQARAIELRILRTSTGGAYGYFTGATKACAPALETIRARWREGVRTGRIELIENPSAAFRSFFNLGG